MERVWRVDEVDYEFYCGCAAASVSAVKESNMLLRRLKASFCLLLSTGIRLFPSQSESAAHEFAQNLVKYCAGVGKGGGEKKCRAPVLGQVINRRRRYLCRKTFNNP